MASEHLWVAPGEIVTDISGYVQVATNGKDGFRVASNAEEGSHGSSEVPFDDPDGTFPVIGLNAYRIRETLSEAADPYIFAGSFTERTEERGPYRTGVSRIVNATIVDLNYGLSKYVIRPGESGDRPAETEAARMTWLLGTTAMDFLAADTTYIDTGSTMLPKANFEEYTPQQVLDSMAQRTAKNYFVWWDGEAEDEVLVYALDSGTHLTSDLRFSNVETDVDDATTFVAGLDWQLKRDPSRIASTVFVRYQNGIEGETDDDTAAEFSRVDRVMDGNWIKTGPDATAQAIQYLADLDSEEFILSGTVYLPAEKASQFRAGMRSEMKAIHLTGMDDFVWVRLLNVTVVNISEGPVLTYALAFEGTFAVTPPPLTCAGVVVDLTGQVSGPLTGTSGMGGSLTPGAGTGLMVAGCAVGENGTALWGPTGNLVVAASGWSNGTSRPQSDTHTGSNLGWKANAGTGSPQWAMTGGGVNPAQDGRQVGVWIPGGTFVQSVSGQTAVNISSGDIVWGTPLTPGNLVIIFGVAEGPTGWGGDITKNDVTSLALIADIDGALEHTSSNVRMAVACVETGDTFQPNSAGSSWWFHAIEVSL